jgi:hypothetical protein
VLQQSTNVFLAEEKEKLPGEGLLWMLKAHIRDALLKHSNRLLAS